MAKIKLTILIAVLFFINALSVSAQSCVDLEQYYSVSLDLTYHSSNNIMLVEGALLNPIIVGDPTNIGFKKYQKNSAMTYSPNFKKITRFSADKNCSILTFKYPVYTTINLTDQNFKDLGTFEDYVDYNCNLNLFIGGKVSGSCSFNGEVKHKTFIDGNSGIVVGGTPITESGTYTITTDFNSTGNFSGRTLKPKRVPKEIKKQLEKG